MMRDRIDIARKDMSQLAWGKARLVGDCCLSTAEHVPKDGISAIQEWYFYHIIIMPVTGESV